jgi:ABC-type uncharacterized transport system permease subunit
VAVLGGAMRVGTPFLFVSLGECLTEKSGRINLGLEGVLVLSAMAGFGGAYLTGSWWLGVLAAGSAARCWPRCTACCARCRASTTWPPASRSCCWAPGLAFYLGKPLIQPQAPQIPAIPLGLTGADSPAIGSALQHQRAVADRRGAGAGLAWGFEEHPLGLTGAHGGRFGRRHAGAGHLGQRRPHRGHRQAGFIAGLGGASLSLYYPGSWNEGCPAARA